MPHDVFISYSSTNSEWAEGVCQLLENNGFVCWMAPRDINPGMTWGAEIVRGINEASVMLLLLSSASNHSRQVAREVQLADSAQLAIIPILLEPVKPEGDFLYFIGNTQWLTAIGGTPQSHSTTLLSAVHNELANAKARRAQGPQAAADATASPAGANVSGLKPVLTGSSGAAAQPAPIPAPQTPPAAALPAPLMATTAAASAAGPPLAVQPIPAAGVSKGPWLWVALGAVVLVAVLWFAFGRQTGAPAPPPAREPGRIAFDKGAPWTGTFEGNVEKTEIRVHIQEGSSSAGKHNFDITVNIPGKAAETAFAVDMGKDGKLQFSLGEEKAPRVECAVELTSDKQNLTGEWRQVKVNRTLRVDFKRSSSQP